MNQGPGLINKRVLPNRRPDSKKPVWSRPPTNWIIWII